MRRQGLRVLVRDWRNDWKRLRREVLFGRRRRVRGVHQAQPTFPAPMGDATGIQTELNRLLDGLP